MAKEKNFKKYTLIGVVVMLILIGLYITPFSIEGELPSCEIPIGGGKCVINLTLPFERASSLHTLDLSFDSIAGHLQGETDITGTHLHSAIVVEEDEAGTYDDYDEVTTWWHHLYKLPDTFPEYIQELKIYATTSGDCVTSGEKEGEGEMEGYLYNLPSSATSVEICKLSRYSDEWEEECPAYEKRSFIRVQRDRDGDYKASEKYMTSLADGGRFRCYKDDDGQPERDSGIPFVDATVVVPVRKTDEIRFLISPMKELEGGTVNIAKPPEKVIVWYKEAEYPTNMVYSVGNTDMETIDGISKEPITTLDFAVQINNYCNRQTSVDECTVPITFTSDTKGGKIIIETETSTLKKVEAPECIVDVDCADGDEFTLDFCVMQECVYKEVECINNADCEDNDDRTPNICESNVCVFNLPNETSEEDVDDATSPPVDTITGDIINPPNQTKEFPLGIFIVGGIIIVGVVSMIIIKKRNN